MKHPPPSPIVTFLLGALVLAPLARSQGIATYMPEEAALHEGTWLQWPHHYTYGLTYRNRLDATWVAMTSALVQSEKVRIIAYDSAQQTRINNLLVLAGVPLANVDFLLRQTDDCWVRDNGPIFAYGPNGDLRVTDWRFNGWGFDTPYLKDDPVPATVATSLGLPRVDLATTVLEGGAVEVDGNGVLMATRSSILEPARNPGLTQAQLEVILSTNLGVTKFLWLNGQSGGSVEITDMHIDGFAKFSEHRTIVTMSSADLLYWGLSTADITTLLGATDINGIPYAFVQLPLTAGNVVTTYGFNVGFKGSYVNYYVANSVVLVPTYADPNDAVAMSLLQQQYPGRTVIGIDSRNLYRDGGMVHCVTQQQPVASRTGLPTSVGVGCPAPPLEIEAFAVPSIDRTMMVAIRGVPASTIFAVLAVGFPQSVPLDSIGMENCSLFTSADLALVPASFSLPSGLGTSSWHVPLLPSAVGLGLSLQLIAVAPGTTSFGIVTSNGLSITLAN